MTSNPAASPRLPGCWRVFIFHLFIRLYLLSHLILVSFILSKCLYTRPERIPRCTNWQWEAWKPWPLSRIILTLLAFHLLCSFDLPFVVAILFLYFSFWIQSLVIFTFCFSSLLRFRIYSHLSPCLRIPISLFSILVFSNDYCYVLTVA